MADRIANPSIRYAHCCPDVQVDYASDSASASSRSKETLSVREVDESELYNAAGDWRNTCDRHQEYAAKRSTRARPSGQRWNETESAADWRTLCATLEQGLHLNVPRSRRCNQSRVSSQSVDQLNAAVPSPGTLGQSASRRADPAGLNACASAVSRSPSPCSRQRDVSNSPHHSRSQSVRLVKRSDYLSPPPDGRQRGTSLPSSAGAHQQTADSDDCYLLRHFIVNGRSVVNRGDSFRNRRSRSNASVNSSAASSVRFVFCCCFHSIDFVFFR